MLLVINKISKSYSKGTPFECKALKEVNLNVNQGDMVAIIGKSGSGKSTLLQILGLLDSFDEGEYFFDGISVKNLNDKQKSTLRNKNIGFVLQDFALIPDMTVFDNVAVPLLIQGISANEIDKRVSEILNELDIFDKARIYTKMLSGGQKQRVAIARALISDPKLILADEPTGALDTETAKEIMRIFQKLNKLNKTIVIVTHDTSLASMCTKIIEISDGNILHNN